ncbi:MetQ/NlpA family ABC transporter substrate-binding protein [Candidatus Enterococcus ferrettii]|uniref:D-methionine transport system substrate-binding protein n=1 Tax=Candidatus Enterococcus ferrettii TaxID=2815324 RepID=A0ABV0ETT5_9ENTE|nr:MetQ/NlpA family ABC transporter substrate-binding protein [Enterococcus sp. 665A]MBO1341346.1 hypothetical protein [Enterococcus sp. 665A]
MKKIVLAFSLLATILIVSGCKSNSEAEEKHEIVMGVTYGPYNDLFDAAIAPILEKEGYTIKRVEFSQFIQSNTALGEGSVDVNVAQHTAYMNVFNKEKKTDLVPLVATPTVPCSLYSSKYESADALKDGMIIGIPQDPSNAARAYAVLAKAGWIKVDPNTKPTELTADSIIENPHNLEIKEMDSTTIPRVLDDLDYEVIPGSVVTEAKIQDQIHLIEQEKVIKDLEIVAAVRKENEDTEWAQAIKKAYQSNEFAAYMKEHNKDNYWTLPEKE